MSQIDYDYIYRLSSLINQYDHVRINMQRLGESTRLALFTSQNSAAMEAMRQNALAVDGIQRLGESTRLALFASQNSAAMEAMRQNALAVDGIQRLGESARLVLSAFQNSAAMEAVRQNAFTVDRIQQIGESARLALSAFQNSAAEARHQSAFTVDRMRRFGESARLALSAFQNSAAMEAIQEFSNTPFISSVTEVVFTELDSLDIEQFDFPEDQDFAIDEDIELEIQKELEENCDYNSLSKKAQLLLSYIYHNYFLPLFLGCLATIIVTNHQKAQISLQDKKTPTDIKSLVRKPILEVNKELLKGHRVVIGSDVNLRKEPSMKSEVITELPIGKLVEVLDKSNRSWLHVEVDIEGETFVGWISRRYTTYFK